MSEILFTDKDVKLCKERLAVKIPGKGHRDQITLSYDKAIALFVRLDRAEQLAKVAFKHRWDFAHVGLGKLLEKWFKIRGLWK